jgi:RNase P/RNase MRP subunit p29
MSKKLLLPVFLALLLALIAGIGVYADAAAQDGIPQARLRKRPGVLGQVTAVTVDQFTIQTRSGQERIFHLTETTRFTDPEKQELSSEDLKTGGWVAVVVARWSGKPPLARLVVILPEDFAPANWSGIRGRVTSVDVAGNTFVLESKDGQATTVKVDAGTKFHGQVTGLGELQVGLLAQATIEEQANGDMLAKSVRAGLPSDKRFLGKVTALNTKSFTIQTRQGKSLTFQVTAETRFRSRRGIVGGLEDLKAGMPVVVGAKDLGNNQYQAVRVLAAPGLRK